MRLLPLCIGILLGLLPATAAAQAGFSATGLARLAAAIDADVAAGRYPGAVVLLERDGQVGYHEAFGRLGPGEAPAMPRDALFRIASMTKPVTSVAALLLLEDGRLALTDPLERHLPAFAAPQVLEPNGGRRPAARPITVRDLLRHTSGLIYGVFQTDSPLGRLYIEAGIWPERRPLADWTAALAQLPLVADPGTAWHYGRSTDVLGQVVAVAAAMPADRFMQARIFEPLGMADTGFVLPPAARARMAQSPGRPFDPAEPPAMISGGGGLISTAADYLMFCRMLLRSGAPLLQPETVAAMTRDQLDGIPFARYGHGFGAGYGFGYGLAVRTGDGDGPGTRGDYGWGGYWGTSFWIDPARRLIAIGMIQNPQARLYFRGRLRDLVYAALAD